MKCAGSFPKGKPKLTPELQRVYRALDACGEVNGCGTAALSIMTGYPVEIVREALRRCGRRPGDGAREDIFRNAARLLGLKIKHVSAHEAIRLAKDGRRVFLFTHNHIFAATEGRLHDPNPWQWITQLTGGIAVLN